MTPLTWGTCASQAELVVKNLSANAGDIRDMGLIPIWGAKIPHASRPKHQNIKQKQYYNKFNK